MRISELCIRRPVMTTLVMASLLLAGFFGYRQLPIAAIPRIEVPTISVSVQYPGASADTMAVSVAAPLERQFSTIAGVTRHHLAQHRGQHADHAGVRPQSQHRCRRARHAVGDLRCGLAAARGPADAAGLSQGQSRRRPRHLPGADLRDGAVAGDERVRRQGDEPASVDAARASRRSTSRARRSARCASKYDLDALATRGISVEEIRQAVTAQSSVSPIGSIRTEPAALHSGGQGRRADGGLLQARRWSPGATARRCGSRISPRSRIWSRTRKRGPSSMPCARSSSRCSASPMPIRSPSPTPSTSCCRNSSGSCRRPSSSTS